MKLPKTVRHWFRDNKIEIEYVDRRGIYGHSRDPRRFGFNRRFRMISTDEFRGFQISDTDFDRWANSVMVTYDIPKSKKEFDAILENVFCEEYPDMGALHIDIEHSSYDCEDCGYYTDTMVMCSNGDQYFHDGHMGSDRFMKVNFYWSDDNAKERFTEYYRALGYRVRVTERFND